MRIALDSEYNSLENPTLIHCICCVDIDTGQEYTFRSDYSEFARWITSARIVIGHNIIDADWRWISLLINDACIPADRVIDTLILSKLHYYRQDGGHSLENWGNLLEHPKVHTGITDWSKWTPQIEERCMNDARLTAEVYRTLAPVLDRSGFQRAIEAEHKLAFICLDMHRNGFRFDSDAARTLHDELSRRVNELDRELLSAFPPKAKDGGVYTPRLTKKGTISKANLRWWPDSDYTVFSPGSSFTRIEWEVFNPASPSQIVARLNDGGWKPTVKTDSGESWKVNEENLSTLPSDAPIAARRLVERLMLASRIRKLEEWLKHYSETTGRIHGKFSALGTWTHRMAHQKPNMGNVSAEKSIKYKGKELRDEAIRLGGIMRGLWGCSDDSYLVGSDFDGAHLRIFAHLINDKDLIEALTKGRKEDGTDPHTLNMHRIGELCTGRELSKTCVYTYLNGGGAPKFASILGCSYEDGKRSLNRFVESYPGLRSFRTKECPRLARQGWFEGLDGRKVPCDSEHHMLAAILQNAEKVIMTYANIKWRQDASRMGLRYKQVVMVHDEWQTESFGGRQAAEALGEIQVSSIVRVGEEFGLRCPLAGNFAIGRNWRETH